MFHIILQSTNLTGKTLIKCADVFNMIITHAKERPKAMSGILHILRNCILCRTKYFLQSSDSLLCHYITADGEKICDEFDLEQTMSRYSTMSRFMARYVKLFHKSHLWSEYLGKWNKQKRADFNKFY